MNNDRFRKFLVFVLGVVVVLMVFGQGVHVSFPPSTRDVLEVLRWTFSSVPLSIPPLEGGAFVTRADVILAFAAIAWLVWIFARRNRPRIRSVPVVVLALGIWPLVSLMAARASGSSNAADDFREVVQHLGYFLVAFALFLGVFSSRNARGIAHLFLLAGAAVVGIGLSLVVIYAKGGSVEPLLRARLIGFRGWSSYARLSALLAPAFFGCAIYDRNFFRKVFWIAATLAALASCVSGPLLVAAIFAILMLSITKGERLFDFVAVLLLVLLPFLWVIPSDLLKADLARGLWLKPATGAASVSEQAELKGEACVSALNSISSNVLMGTGPGKVIRAPSVASYKDSALSAEERRALVEAATPAPYLLLAARMGVPMLVFLIWVFFLFSRRSLLALAETSDPSRRGIVAGLFGAVLAFAIANLWTPMIVHETGLPFAFVLACLWRMSEPPEEEGVPAREPRREEPLEVPLLDLS